MGLFLEDIAAKGLMVVASIVSLIMDPSLSVKQIS